MIAVAGGAPISSQSVSVLPVTVQIKPGETSATLTVINESDSDANVQIRAWAWTQSDNGDELAPSDQLAISPPRAVIAPRAAQIIRLALKPRSSGREGAYRILIDQIPALAAPGMVRIALRLSVPVFMEPKTNSSQSLRFKIERQGEQAWLVAQNVGTRHQTVRDVAITRDDGSTLKAASGVSPYILAGATHRWVIIPQGALPAAGSTLRLAAATQAGAINQRVLVELRP